MSANCDAIIIFPIYGLFGAIRKPDSGRIAVKLIFIKNLQHSSLIIALSKGTIFAKKYADFLQKMLTSTRLARSWY